MDEFFARLRRRKMVQWALAYAAVVWSETYDGDRKDVFELQERIARAIAMQLQVVLKAPEPASAPEIIAAGVYGDVMAHIANLRGLRLGAASFGDT